ncbi:MAG: hypothetical protein H0T76_25520 [Nannocystis sp.]|nr:hypothetical protein [Nannocystis sp.]
MIVGNGALYLSLVTLAVSRAPLPSYLDVIAGLAVVLMIGARRVDITHFQGRTVSDEQATLAHWRRYSLSVTAIAALAWLLAHYIAGNLSG